MVCSEDFEAVDKGCEVNPEVADTELSPRAAETLLDPPRETLLVAVEARLVELES